MKLVDAIMDGERNCVNFTEEIIVGYSAYIASFTRANLYQKITGPCAVTIDESFT